MNYKSKKLLFSVVYIKEKAVINREYCLWILILIFGWIGSIGSNCNAQEINQIELKYQPENTLLSQVNQEPLVPPSPIPETETPKKVEPSPALDTPETETNSVKINKINVVGSTIFHSQDFQPIIKPLEGKTSSLAELKATADQITQLYLEDGYITSRAVVVSDSLADGNVKIEVIEGIVDLIRVVGADRLIKYVRSRVNLGVGSPLNTGELEEQLRLLRIDPLIENIEAKISSGKGIGQSTIVVRVEAAKSLSLQAGIDNYSPPSIGSERLNLEAAYQNVTGLGDILSVAYRPSIEAFGGTYSLDFDYKIPINAKNGTIAAGIDINRSEVINDFAEDLDINGETERYNISYRQPLIRSTSQELALSLGFDYQDGQTFLFQEGFPFGLGPDEDDGVSKTSVLRFGKDYVLRQPSGAWAFGSSFNLGLGIFGATDNEGSIPDGQFFSWLGQAQRLQVLNDDNFLIIQAEFQLASDSLLASQQFVIGGGQSIRGYRQNVRSGDNGLRFLIEDRWTVIQNRIGQPQLTLAPFFNMGTVWNDGDNPNDLTNQNFIAALGLGVIWQPFEDLNLRVDYAPPLVDLDDRGDNIQDNGLHFSLSYSKQI